MQNGGAPTRPTIHRQIKMCVCVCNAYTHIAMARYFPLYSFRRTRKYCELHTTRPGYSGLAVGAQCPRKSSDSENWIATADLESRPMPLSLTLLFRSRSPTCAATPDGRVQ